MMRCGPWADAERQIDGKSDCQWSGRGQGCQAGTPPSTDDGVTCTDDSCDEVNDVVVNLPNDGNCGNGDFCDGAETCDVSTEC